MSLRDLNISEVKILLRNKIQIIITLLLLVGLGVMIYLVQTKQIFKSGAADSLIRQFNATGQNGESVTKTSDGNFNTTTLNVNVTFADPGTLPPQEVPGSGDTGGSTPTIDPCDPQNPANYDQFAGCDNSSCGYELWSCRNDRNRLEPFQHPDSQSSCYQPENNSACSS